MKCTLFFLFLFIAYFTNAQAYDIYVSDAGNWQTGPYKIMKYDHEGKNAEIFIENNIAWPQDILFLEDQGIVLISNLNTNDINKFNADTGEFIGKFADVPSGPTRMKIKDNTLYVLSWRSPFQVVRFSLDGNPMENFTSQGTVQSIGMDWDDEGNLYVSSYKGFVNQYNASGEFLKTFIQTNVQGPTNIWRDQDGTWIVLDYNASTVKRFNAEGQFMEALATGLQYCEGIAMTSEGHYLIGHGGNSSVDEYDEDWNAVDELIPTGEGGLKLPNAVVLRQKPNATGEQNSKRTEFKPSVGNIFAIEWGDDAAYCEIFDMGGVKVDRLPKTNSEWNADYLPAAAYLVKVTNDDGDSYFQKIIVQH